MVRYHILPCPPTLMLIHTHIESTHSTRQPWTFCPLYRVDKLYILKLYNSQSYMFLCMLGSHMIQNALKEIFYFIYSFQTFFDCAMPAPEYGLWQHVCLSLLGIELLEWPGSLHYWTATTAVDSSRAFPLLSLLNII